MIGLDVDQITDNLRNLGFIAQGKHQGFRLELKKHNDQSFFDALFEVVEQAAQEIEDTLTNQ